MGRGCPYSASLSSHSQKVYIASSPRYSTLFVYSLFLFVSACNSTLPSPFFSLVDLHWYSHHYPITSFHSPAAEIFPSPLSFSLGFALWIHPFFNLLHRDPVALSTFPHLPLPPLNPSVMAFAKPISPLLCFLENPFFSPLPHFFPSRSFSLYLRLAGNF